MCVMMMIKLMMIMTVWGGSSSRAHLYVDFDRLNGQFVVLGDGEAPAALQIQKRVWGLWTFRPAVDGCVRSVSYFTITYDKRFLNYGWLDIVQATSIRLSTKLQGSVPTRTAISFKTDQVIDFYAIKIRTNMISCLELFNFNMLKSCLRC